MLAVLLVAMVQVAGTTDVLPKAGDASPQILEFRKTAEKHVRDKLKDDESARFSDVAAFTHNGKFFECGYVNSKNSYGGYSGKDKFFATLDSGFVEGDGIDLAFLRRIWQSCMDQSKEP